MPHRFVFQSSIHLSPGIWDRKKNWLYERWKLTINKRTNKQEHITVGVLSSSKNPHTTGLGSATSRRPWLFQDMELSNEVLRSLWPWHLRGFWGQIPSPFLLLGHWKVVFILFYFTYQTLWSPCVASSLEALQPVDLGLEPPKQNSFLSSYYVQQMNPEGKQHSAQLSSLLCLLRSSPLPWLAGKAVSLMWAFLARK